MNKYLSVFFISTMLSMSHVVAEPLSVTGSDDIESILAAHSGKRVTVQMKSGGEFKGKVGEVNGDIVHLMELTGKEFFDAVVSINMIEAVIIRTRN
ncbi:MAG: hypothetical protein HND53_12125 [Proteobacteria bacterium]|nr:hypothetical protein [Pseudomonadota bacterium]NOG61241.1 hypothetical protein [Pseudomonadota bacterium]